MGRLGSVVILYRWRRIFIFAMMIVMMVVMDDADVAQLDVVEILLPPGFFGFSEVDFSFLDRLLRL